MTNKIKELRKVLDMPEDEQRKWIWRQPNLISNDYKESGIPTVLIFAELAFRLRDEARRSHIEQWNIAIAIVASHINDSPPLKELQVSKGEWQWAQHILLNQIDYSLSILWIIAALIAKELS